MGKHRYLPIRCRAPYRLIPGAVDLLASNKEVLFIGQSEGFAPKNELLRIYQYAPLYNGASG